MPLTDKDRQRRRRQRRRRRLHELKARLAETSDPKNRKRFLAKIQKLEPWAPIPDK